MTRRIERAKALLRRGDLPVTEVCMSVACTSLGSFSARFTELVRETPTAYRARDDGALARTVPCATRRAIWCASTSRPPRNRGVQARSVSRSRES
jgi:AraC-like DNA-binding protein